MDPYYPNSMYPQMLNQAIQSHIYGQGMQPVMGTQPNMAGQGTPSIDLCQMLKDQLQSMGFPQVQSGALPQIQPVTLSQPVSSKKTTNETFEPNETSIVKWEVTLCKQLECKLENINLFMKTTQQEFRQTIYWLPNQNIYLSARKSPDGKALNVIIDGSSIRLVSNTYHLMKGEIKLSTCPSYLVKFDSILDGRSIILAPLSEAVFKSNSTLRFEMVYEQVKMVQDPSPSLTEQLKDMSLSDNKGVSAEPIVKMTQALSPSLNEPANSDDSDDELEPYFPKNASKTFFVSKFEISKKPAISDDSDEELEPYFSENSSKSNESTATSFSSLQMSNDPLFGWKK